VGSLPSGTLFKTICQVAVGVKLLMWTLARANVENKAP